MNRMVDGESKLTITFYPKSKVITEYTKEKRYLLE